MCLNFIHVRPRRCVWRVEGPVWVMRKAQGVTKVVDSRIGLEGPTIQGDSPVDEISNSPDRYPSRASHVEPGLNSEGPPSKAKYSLATDSVRVARANIEKYPC